MGPGGQPPSGTPSSPYPVPFRSLKLTITAAGQASWSSPSSSSCLGYGRWKVWWDETVFDGDMLQCFPVAADLAFLSFQPLSGSMGVVQDLSVSSSEEEEIWAATFSSVAAVAASCSSSPPYSVSLVQSRVLGPGPMDGPCLGGQLLPLPCLAPRG